VQTGTNLAASFLIEKGDVDAVFAAADVVVEETIRCGRHAAVPLETRGLLAELEPLSGDLVVYGAAKVVHVNRRILARLLRWPEERIRLVAPCVGGGFGARGEFYPEDFLIPFCAIRLGRPVRWIEDRAEHLRSANHSREQVHEIAIALAADGRFLGLRDRFLNNTGAYVSASIPSISGAATSSSPARCRTRRGRTRTDTRSSTTVVISRCSWRRALTSPASPSAGSASAAIWPEMKRRLPFLQPPESGRDRHHLRVSGV
jgi:aerobic carbon-monoxide dehydrogenase large subunit